MSSIALPTSRRPPHHGLLVALALSLAAHVLLLTLTPRPRFDEVGPRTEREPLRVEIVSRAPEVAAPAPEPVDLPTPVPKTLPRRPARPEPAPTPPQPRRAPQTPPPVQQAPASTRPAAPFDMAAMIEARREQRRRADEAMGQGAEAPPQVAQDAGLASLNRNLRTLSGREGVGGVFTILHMGTRTGEFAFNGWRPDSRRQWREVIEVDAGPNGNLELAMVRRMISLIREHYTGDFNWQSHRLQRTVILSARKEDNAELEDFMMREFFGTPVLKPK